jgi:hypothetical protein
MADNTNEVQVNVSAEATMLNNFVAGEVVETNTEKANASFAALPEMELDRYLKEMNEQTLRSQTYISPKIDSAPDTTKVDMVKLEKDFNSFRDQLNVVLPKNIEEIYSTITSLFQELNDRDKETDPRPVKPFLNDIFSTRSRQINQPPLWL